MAGKMMALKTEVRKPGGGISLGSKEMSGFARFNFEVVTGSCETQENN